jgi:hypothetical protein
MARMVAVNADGTSFLANLNEMCSVRITLSEAYTLANQLRGMADSTDKAIAVAQISEPEILDQLAEMAGDLRKRAREIERSIDADKSDQHESAGGEYVRQD